MRSLTSVEDFVLHYMSVISASLCIRSRMVVWMNHFTHMVIKPFFLPIKTTLRTKAVSETTFFNRKGPIKISSNLPLFSVILFVSKYEITKPWIRNIYYFYIFLSYFNYVLIKCFTFYFFRDECFDKILTTPWVTKYHTSN